MSSNFWSGGGINKGWLVELLRKHPNWDEDSLSIVFDVNVDRKADSNVVSYYRNDVRSLGNELLAAEQLRSFDTALYAATAHSDQYLKCGSCRAQIEQSSGVSCKIGQKTSRVINQVCRHYGVDKHPAYNAKFALLADSLNPLTITRKALLSVHPCDYLEMSNIYNSWHSCHNLEDGAYRGGTLSYLGDVCTMIFYTAEPDHDNPAYAAPKITREVFAYKDGVLLQSRLYPNYTNTDTQRNYRAIVQMAISECLATPNLWSCINHEDCALEYVETCGDALHYRDYEYSEYRPTISLLQDIYNLATSRILVGSVAKCLLCDNTVWNEGEVHCDRCAGGYTCTECGGHIADEDDARWVNGEPYCEDCANVCDRCDEATLDPLETALDAYGDEVAICSSCADDAFYCWRCDTLYLHGPLIEVGEQFVCQTCAAELNEQVTA